MIGLELLKQNIANNVKRLRTQKRYSQKQLAEAAELSQITLNNLENCKNEPSLGVLYQVSQVLECNIEELFR